MAGNGRRWSRAVVLLAVGGLLVVVGIVVLRRSSTTGGSGTAAASVVRSRTVFAEVPGHYDAALRRAFPGQRFQVAFGDRSPSAPSSETYRIAAARGATGLLRATTAGGDVVALDMVPVPDGFTVTNSDTGFRSTAVALIAMSPGLLTADPYADLLLLREISQLSEIDELAAQLQHAARVYGPGYLNRPQAAVVTTVAAAVTDLETGLAADVQAVRSDPGSVTTPPPGSTTTPPPAPAPSVPGSPQPSASWSAVPALQSPASDHPPSCDGAGLQPVGGLEGDDICLTALDDQTPPAVAAEQVSVRAVNRAPRWAIVTRPNENDVWPSGLITPKRWSVPGLSDLLSAVADAVANSSQVDGFKGAAAWLDQIDGVDYHPYYGADDFIAALQLSVRRFASDSVSDLTLTPDASRQVETLTLGRPWPDDPGAPPATSGWRSVLPILLTLFDGIVKPVVLVVMDIKSAVLSAKSAAAKEEVEKQTQQATKAGTVVMPGTGCKTEEQPGLSRTKVLYICRMAEDGRLHWRRPLDDAAVGDEQAANNDDCMHDYIGLAAALAPKLAEIGNSLTKSGDANLLSGLAGVLGAIVGHPKALGCLMSQVLFTAAKDGTLGAAAQEAAGVLAEHNIVTVDQLVTLVQHGEGLGNLAAQAVTGLLTSIVSSVTDTVVTKVTEKIALSIAPGGDLLAAVNIAEKAGDISGLVLGVADLVNAEINYSDGSVYTFAAPDAIRTAAAQYPHQVGPDGGIAVPYTPTYWGNADWLAGGATGSRQAGFWVSGSGELDVFHADGSPDYTIRAAAVGSRLVLVKDTPASVTPVWTTSVPETSFGDVGIVADDRTGNLLTYTSGLVVSGLKIFNAQTGALITDVDAQYQKAGYSAGVSAGWAVFGNGNLLATTLVGSSGDGSWLTSFTGGPGTAVPGAWGSPVALWSDAGSWYVAFDDRSYWRNTGTGLVRAGTLTSTPATNVNGISDPICGGTVSYVSDDGFVVRDRQGGSNAWTVHVDPAQGTGPGNRTLVSVVDPKTCDVVAADDHGVITRYSGTGNPPRAVWTTRYGYLARQGQSATGSPYPVSDLQLTATTVFAVSNYDPHLAAFSLATGARLYSYPLGSAAIALPRLDNGDLLAIGGDGGLTLLQAG